jgi:hypothetical protein
MIRQDFILRQIQLLAKFIEKILVNKKEGHFPEALKEVDTALKEIAGIDYSLIQALSESELLNFLNITKNNEVVASKCIIIAKLLKEQAEIRCRIPEAVNYNPIDDYKKALSLFNEAFSRCDKDVSVLKEYTNDIMDLKKMIAKHEQ